MAIGTQKVAFGALNDGEADSALRLARIAIAVFVIAIVPTVFFSLRTYGSFQLFDQRMKRERR